MASTSARADGRPSEVRETDHQQLEQWCVEYAETRCPLLRDRIVDSHAWLVRICAKQMLRRGESLDDLMQVGNIGLMKALDRFDPSFNVRFRTFASVTIDGELRRYYRGTWRIHVPRSVQERHHAVSRAVETLTSANGRSPRTHEIADYLGCSDEAVLEAIAAGAAFAPAGLEGATGPDREGALADDGSSRSFDGADHRVLLNALLSTLGERERRVVFLRFFEDCTQVEIAEQLGISQVHVSRLLRASLDRLRSVAEKQSLPQLSST